MNRSACETSCVPKRVRQSWTTRETGYETYVVIGDVGEVVGSDESPDGLDKVFDGGRLGELIWVEFDVELIADLSTRASHSTTPRTSVISKMTVLRRAGKDGLRSSG